MSKTSELDIELHNLAADFRWIAKTFNVDKLELYKMFNKYVKDDQL